MKKLLLITAAILTTAVFAGCARTSQQISPLKSYPLDGLEGVASNSGVEFDSDVSSAGNGSLRVDAHEPVTVSLIAIDDIDIENATLVYRAKLRTENLQGSAYIEMLCSFEGMGEYFSRGLQSQLSGNTEWKTVETPFFLKKGENPESVKLNVVVNGAGTVWIDDIELFKKPLK